MSSNSSVESLIIQIEKMETPNMNTFPQWYLIVQKMHLEAFKGISQSTLNKLMAIVIALGQFSSKITKSTTKNTSTLCPNWKKIFQCKLNSDDMKKLEDDLKGQSESDIVLSLAIRLCKSLVLDVAEFNTFGAYQMLHNIFCSWNSIPERLLGTIVAFLLAYAEYFINSLQIPNPDEKKLFFSWTSPCVYQLLFNHLINPNCTIKPSIAVLLILITRKYHVSEIYSWRIKLLSSRMKALKDDPYMKIWGRFALELGRGSVKMPKTLFSEDAGCGLDWEWNCKSVKKIGVFNPASYVYKVDWVQAIFSDLRWIHRLRSSRKLRLDFENHLESHHQHRFLLFILSSIFRHSTMHPKMQIPRAFLDYDGPNSFVEFHIDKTTLKKVENLPMQFTIISGDEFLSNRPAKVHKFGLGDIEETLSNNPNSELASIHSLGISSEADNDELEGRKLSNPKKRYRRTNMATIIFRTLDLTPNELSCNLLDLFRVDGHLSKEEWNRCFFALTRWLIWDPITVSCTLSSVLVENIRAYQWKVSASTKSVMQLFLSVLPFSRWDGLVLKVLMSKVGTPVTSWVYLLVIMESVISSLTLEANLADLLKSSWTSKGVEFLNGLCRICLGPSVVQKYPVYSQIAKEKMIELRPRPLWDICLLLLRRAQNLNIKLDDGMVLKYYSMSSNDCISNAIKNLQ